MIKTIYIFTLTLLICTCGQRNTNSGNQKKSEQPIAAVNTTKTNQATEKLTKLDSIDKEHSFSIKH